MNQVFLTNLKDLFLNIRLTDVLDFVLVSIFFYGIISWVKRSLSRRAITALSMLLGVYIMAHLLNLYITERLLQALFIIILIILVVIFQNDIRRMVDWIGSWSLGHADSTVSKTSHVTDIITEALSKMAEKRIGALVAIRGKEPWDLHIHGGTELNGEISEKLLMSIFNTKAPGHDGAVLVEGEKVLKFGTHLPLTIKKSGIRQGGTRHAAAIGLSEICDAFVIVVSEERGTISIAQQGRLTQLQSASELKGKLEKFWNEHYRQENQPSSGWIQKTNVKTGLLAVFLALVLWIVFPSRSETVYRTYTVPLELRNLNNNYALMEPVAESVQITLSGSERVVQSVDPSKLVTSINLSNVQPGQNEISITKDNLNLPSGVNLYDAEPQNIEVSIGRLKKVTIPVKVQTTGKLPEPLKLESARPTPEAMMLLIPESEKNTPSVILTEPIELDSITESKSLQRSIILPKNFRLAPDQNPIVDIQLQVKPSK